MSIQQLLIANRGEIAIRIARTARQLGISCIAVYPEDDRDALHVRQLERAQLLPRNGAAAYLDMDEIIAAAKRADADAIHPGYGFLSENSKFSARCAQEGLVFVGPDSETLACLADKAAARKLAIEAGVPVLAGCNEAVTPEDALAFFDELEPGSALFIKALAGGGGRGMRLVRDKSDVKAAYDSASREAAAAFGDGRVYVERFMPAARHIEVQVLGDGEQVVHLCERDCSLQRRNQKIIEITPAIGLSDDLKARLYEAALSMAKAVSYRGLGTFEFLVSTLDGSYAFLEANPRIQVEHTITEEILDMDLVAAQLQVFMGQSLDDQHITQAAISLKGFAAQARVCAEIFDTDGTVRPASGKITKHELPQGRGVRIESSVYTGWVANPRYDALMSKVIVADSNCDYAGILRRTDQALAEYDIGGIQTNIPFLRAVLQNDQVIQGKISTRFVDENMSSLLAACPKQRPLFEEDTTDVGDVEVRIPEGAVPILSPLVGTVVDCLVVAGELVAKDQPVAILEAMKMEHQIVADTGGLVLDVLATAGMTVSGNMPLVILRPQVVDAVDVAEGIVADPDYIRSDLAALQMKKEAILDGARNAAVAKRHGYGKTTIRENIDRLVDEGSLSEYGGLNIAAQRSRHDVETLEKISPADGMVAGTACVNGQYFDENASACVVLGYDYMVFAGTQGVLNHKKTDRLLHLAEKRQLPIIFYGEGGGGRPGDVDINAASTLDVPTFQTYARLSGLVPRIGIASGRCFAGNAALMGLSDILIATKDTSIGMGGPAMIEGGGLGIFKPEEVGPVSMQASNGVIDIVVEDEFEATDVAKNLLSYFQGAVNDWQEADQRELRSVIPENRLRVYDIRTVINILADTGSVQEVRPDFARGMITAFIRMEGRPMGLIANNPLHLGGAIDADGSEKAARHIQLCDAFDIPILTLCDTPGFMVGPEAEQTALVRKTARLFAAAGSITVPVFTVILRKAYGLGAQAMGGGSMHAPFLCVSWPTGEMGPMGLEGAVRLGFRKELEAIEDEAARTAAFDAMVAEAYIRGKAVNAAAYMEIDDVIDPAETRNRLVQGLKSAGISLPRKGKKRTFVDTW